MSTSKYVLKSAAASKYKTSTPFTKNQVLPPIEETASSVATNSSLCVIPSDIPRIFTKDHSPFRSEYALLSHEQYKGLPKGNGGFQGVVPWYIDHDGSIQYVLNISLKHKLLSYIGGGLKAREKPINSLYREIAEETPQWSNYLIGLLENPAYQRLIVVKDEYNPNQSDENKRHIRLSTTIYLRIDPDIINQTTFQPSDEVDRLYIIPSDDLPYYTPVDNYEVKFEGTENGLSNGVNDMVEMITNPSLFHYLWVYFRKNMKKEEYISYLKWIYGKNNVENKIVWENTPISTQKNTKKSTEKSSTSKKATRKKSKKKK